MATMIEVLQVVGWYPESAVSLRRLKISSCRTSHPHLQACPVRPEMPGVFSWAAVNIASWTSLFVTSAYLMSSGLGDRSIRGSSGREGGLGNRCLWRVLHFASCVVAGGESSPVRMGGEVEVLFCLVQFLIFQMFCVFTSVAIFW